MPPTSFPKAMSVATGISEVNHFVVFYCFSFHYFYYYLLVDVCFI